MINKNSCFVLCLICSNLVFAEQNIQQQINQRLDDQRVQIKPVKINEIPKPKLAISKPTSENTISVTKTELAQRPDLIIGGLIPALNNDDADAVSLFLPLYQGLPSSYLDKTAIKWGTAILAKSPAYR